METNLSAVAAIPVLLLATFVYLCALGLYPLVLAGPAALAAINDPNWKDAIDQQVDVFS